jgi:lipopolysaccharide biosynthesis regulator YciM
MDLLQWFEFASYVVTVVGLPLAIAVFIYEQRRERKNEEEEIYQRLSDEYMDFLKLVLDNADLQLLRQQTRAGELTPEQVERRFALFGILVSIFERAYLLVFEEKMDKQTRRLWLSWEDYMREWCCRKEFQAALPELLKGEDEDFRRYIVRISTEEKAKGQRTGAAGELN